MIFQSVSLNTDVMTMTGLSEIEEHADRIVMRTPSEPDYWMGNCVIWRNLSDDPKAQVLGFQNDFPMTEHAAVMWDVPNLDATPIAAAMSGQGYEVGSFDVLTKVGPISPRAAPDGIVLRPLEGDDDWAKNADLQLEIAAEEGRDMATYPAYLSRRNAARRSQIAREFGQWFGAFSGDDLVGSMGMFTDAQFARYQAVETRASYRRQGICSALLAYVSAWGASRAPNALQVIVTQADSDAGRLYRAVGFAPTERMVEALKPGS